MKTADAVPELLVVDTDAVVTEADAVALWNAGARVIGRCILHPTRHDQDATQAEMVRLANPTPNRGGFGWYLYAYYRDSGHSAETGAADGAAARAKSDEVGLPLGAWLMCDGEASHPGDLVAYDRAWFEASDTSAQQSCLRVLYDAQFLTTSEKDASGFQVFCRSGMLTPHAPSAGYAMVQHQQTRLGGVVVDTNTVQADSNGQLPKFAVTDAWTGWDLPSPRPAPHPLPPNGPTLALRRIIDGETNHQRVLRIAYESTDPSDRALLEPGVRTVPWTCECRLRSFVWHASLRPEDGLDAVVEVNGMRFGGDPHLITARGFEAAICPYWGPEQHAGKPWVIAPASILCTGGHIFMVYACAEVGCGVWKLWTIEGGQVAGACAKGLHSWHLDTEGLIVEELITDGRHVGDCQRLVRTIALDRNGCVAGWYSCSEFGGWGLGVPDAAPLPAPGPRPVFPPALDLLLTVKGLQTALKRLGHNPGPVDGIMGIRTRSAIRAFQMTVSGLAIDGVMGQTTHDAIEVALEAQARSSCAGISIANIPTNEEK